jgi:hypothetical protein
MKARGCLGRRTGGRRDTGQGRTWTRVSQQRSTLVRNPVPGVEERDDSERDDSERDDSERDDSERDDSEAHQTDRCRIQRITVKESD